MEQLTPIVFTNRKGLRLFGILHMPPSSARKDVGILLLSPGVKMRVGPECLYRRMTELFIRLGFPVFRFDFYGLGDSEGDLEETLLVDVYNHIEMGRFVDDTIDAVDWMQQHCGVSRVVVSGLCGGAVTGLLAGNRDNRIAGLISLGITPVLASRAADASLYMTETQVMHAKKRYFRSLVNFKAWWRFLTLRSDYRLVWRALIKPLIRPLKGKTPDGENDGAGKDNANPLFPPAFFNMLASNRPMLLIFSGADRLYGEFQEKFVAKYKDRLQHVASGYDMHIIPHANHVLSLREWQRQMLDIAAQWLERRFPFPTGAGVVHSNL